MTQPTSDPLPVQPCGCLTPHSKPLANEVISVTDVGPWVLVDDWVWQGLKKRLRGLGARVYERHPNRNARRGYGVRPGPKRPALEEMDDELPAGH